MTRQVQATRQSGSGSCAEGRTARTFKLSDLPPPDTERWGFRRKAAVVSAVLAKVLTMEDACRRYRLSREELQSWIEQIRRHGAHGLRVTRLQDYGRISDERRDRDSL